MNNDNNKIIKDNKLIKKNYDNRKILAIGYYYYPGEKDTYGKKINSCLKAGYSESYVKDNYREILELDRFTAIMDVQWNNLGNNLIIINNVLKQWLNKLDKNVETVDIRELTKIIRLIGDLQGKFIKREMKVTASKEEKHIYHHFDTKEDEIKYLDEVTAIANKRKKELRSIANKRLKELNK